MTGLVSLVGAGPGDPELLTVRAVSRLQAADLILYDALVAPEVLDLAPKARRIHVGKRAGNHTVSQRTIERIAIRAARRGSRVVRLKAGDPFVFGRGGEEALAIAAAGVPFEIVPGVSSALGAPALMGIPVTHRGISSSFMVLSGHAPEAFVPVLHSLAPGSTTIVVLMGVRNRQLIARTLMECGWAPTTPTAIGLAISTPSERHWHGTLADLAEHGVAGAAEESPGTIVVGEVVRVGRALFGVETQTAGVGNGGAR